MFGIPSQMKPQPTKLLKEKGDHPCYATAGLVVLLDRRPNPDLDRHPSQEEGRDSAGCPCTTDLDSAHGFQEVGGSPD